MKKIEIDLRKDIFSIFQIKNFNSAKFVLSE